MPLSVSRYITRSLRRASTRRASKSAGLSWYSLKRVAFSTRMLRPAMSTICRVTVSIGRKIWRPPASPTRAKRTVSSFETTGAPSPVWTACSLRRRNVSRSIHTDPR